MRKRLVARRLDCALITVFSMALLAGCRESPRKTCEALRDLEIGTYADSVLLVALKDVNEADRAALLKDAALEREAVARYWVPACLTQPPEDLRCIGQEVAGISRIDEYINGGYQRRCTGVITRIWDSVKQEMKKQ